MSEERQMTPELVKALLDYLDSIAPGSTTRVFAQEILDIVLHLCEGNSVFAANSLKAVRRLIGR
jgi:hypothetical protein